MITSTSDLNNCLAAVYVHGAVAMDTEFVWDKTYYPGLGLVQLGISPEAAWLIDAPALLDPTAVGALINDAGIVKVLHDARQDLCIMKRWCGGIPRNVFDTRLAAGFCGLSSSLSLQALLREVLKIELEKTETRTDWLRRPLSDRQLAYALDDVRHMLELRDRLLAMAQEAGTLAWLQEEMQSLDNPALYEDRPANEMWERVKGAGRLDGQGLAVLRELAAFREKTAQVRDLPRSWLLEDEVLITLSDMPLLSPDDLLGVRGITERQRNWIGRDLVAACRRGQAVPRDQWPPRPASRRIDDAVKKRTDVVLAWLKERGTALKIDPVLFGSRADITTLVEAAPAGGPDPRYPLLHGWRWEAAGRDLLAIL